MCEYVSAQQSQEVKEAEQISYVSRLQQTCRYSSMLQPQDSRLHVTLVRSCT